MTEKPNKHLLELLCIYRLKRSFIEDFKRIVHKRYHSMDEEFMRSLTPPDETPDNVRQKIRAFMHVMRNAEQECLDAIRDLEDWCDEKLGDCYDEIETLYEAISGKVEKYLRDHPEEVEQEEDYNHDNEGQEENES